MRRLRKMKVILEITSGFIKSIIIGSVFTFVPIVMKAWVDTGKPRKETATDRLSSIESQIGDLRRDMAESFHDLRNR